MQHSKLLMVPENIGWHVNWEDPLPLISTKKCLTHFSSIHSGCPTTLVDRADRKEKLPWQVVLPHRGKHLNQYRILQCFRPVIFITYDTPTVTRVAYNFFRTDWKLYLPGNKVPGFTKQKRRGINLKNYLFKEPPTICLPGALRTKTPLRQLARAYIKISVFTDMYLWWRCRELNPGHYGYEPYALTIWATSPML